MAGGRAFPLPLRQRCCHRGQDRRTRPGRPGNVMETTGCNQVKNAVKVGNAAMR